MSDDDGGVEFIESDGAFMLDEALVAHAVALGESGLFDMVWVRLVDEHGVYIDVLIPPWGARVLGDALVEVGDALPDWPVHPDV